MPPVENYQKFGDWGKKAIKRMLGMPHVNAHLQGGVEQHDNDARLLAHRSAIGETTVPVFAQKMMKESLPSG